MGLALHEMYKVSGMMIRGIHPVNRGATSVEEERPSSARDLLRSVVLHPHLQAGDRMEERGNQADVMGNLSVPQGE